MVLARSSFSSPPIADRDAQDRLLFFTRDADSAGKVRRFSERDLIELGLQGFYAGIAAAVPHKHWAKVAQSMASLRIAKHRRKWHRPFSEAVQASFGALPPEDIDAMFRAWRSRLHGRRLSVMADLLSSRRPDFHISGSEALDRSVSAGKGVILWSLQFAFQTLAGKRGLHEAGYRISQVSSRLHGPSHTAFGTAVTNHCAVAAENRYLAERLVFDADEGPTVLRRALRALHKGGIVTFTNTTFSGRSFVEIPFGKAAFIQMPVTPVALAAAHGIPLHVLATVEMAPFAAYQIEISEDLTACLNGTRPRDHTALTPVFLAARDRLFDVAQRHPDQFLVWTNVKTAPSYPAKAKDLQAGSAQGGNC